MTATLQTYLDPRRNALNAVRLVLALTVVVWHSFPLTGHEVSFGPVRQLLGSGPVDGFFAISGYLITRSWFGRRRWVPFLRARLLRIMPAFWVALVVTAAFFAPLSLMLEGRTPTSESMRAGGHYVLVNAALWINDYGIDGTLRDVPYPDVWNGSMWTLAWEFLCYLGVLVLGVTRLLDRRWVVPVLFLGAVAGVVATSYGPVDNYFVKLGAHFGTMFLAGALLYQFRESLPVRAPLVIASVVAVAAAAFLPDYRVVAALPVAYLVLVVGASIRRPAFRLPNDVSYGAYIYAFPIQQLLVVAGAGVLPVPVFALLAIVCVLPVAVASWFVVEKRVLRLARPRTRTAPQASMTQAG